MSSQSLEDTIHSEFVHIFPDHETELRNKLYQQWQENQFCDLTISLKGGKLHAHSCVLVAFSPKLKTIVDNLNPVSEDANEKMIHLTFQERVLRCLLNMMYTGVLSFSTAILSSVLSTARWLQMDEVVKLCQEYKEVMGNSFNESMVADDSFLTEIDVDDAREDGVSVHQAVNHDTFLETEIHSRKQRSGAKRGCSSKAVSLSPRGLQKKSRKGKRNTNSVIVKLEPEVSATEPETKLSDPVGNITDEMATVVHLPKRRSGRPKKKKSKPIKAKKSTEQEKNEPATPLITAVKTENPSPEESMDFSFSDHDFISHMQWVEAPDSGGHGKEEADFAMGKSDHVRCKKCLVKFKDLDKYLCHIADHPSFKCDHCDVTYYRLSNLTRHMRTSHSTEHHLLCKNCDFLAQSETVLRNHFKEVHGGNKPFICDHPGCTYSSWKFDFLRRHSEIHSEIKQYVCTKCGQGFSQQAGLMSHERTCYHLQQFLCDVCGQAFNHLQSMRAHRRTIHFGEKPYLCKVCGSQFSDQRNLKRHMRIHENSFPYQCPACPQQYRHSNSLKAHLKKHEKDGVSIKVSKMIQREGAQKKTGKRRSKQDVPRELSGNCDDSEVRSDFETSSPVGAGQCVHNAAETVFPGQLTTTSTPQPQDQSTATTVESPSLSEVTPCLDPRGSEVESGGKVVRGCWNVLNRLGSSEEAGASDSFAIPQLHVSDQNLDQGTTDIIITPVIHHTPASLSQPQAEDFLISPSQDSSLDKIEPLLTTADSGITAVKVEVLSAGSSDAVQTPRCSGSLQADDDSCDARKTQWLERDRGESRKDTKLKGQSSYGLETLAEICFSSSV